MCRLNVAIGRLDSVITEKKITFAGRDVDFVVMELANEIKKGFTIVSWELERNTKSLGDGLRFKDEPVVTVTLVPKKGGYQFD